MSRPYLLNVAEGLTAGRGIPKGTTAQRRTANWRRMRRGVLRSMHMTSRHNSLYWIETGPNHVLKRASMLKWARWFGNIDNRRVAYDEFDGYRVSTVCLGMDHSYTNDGPPILYETMAFLGEDHGGLWQERYSTREQALAGHTVMVERVRSGEFAPVAVAVDDEETQHEHQ